MGEGKQLQPGRSRLRSQPVDPRAELPDPAIAGHSMGGMVSLAYAGTYPAQVSRLGILDGIFLAGARRTPIHEQMSRWIDQLDRIGEREVARSGPSRRRRSGFRRATSV
jgi:pimeloyl-ACP methyl ester carboxylesterase